MKRIITVILVCLLMASSVSAAQITDAHLETIKEFDIFEGETREEMELQSLMTRAQFCKAAFNMVKWQSGYFQAEYDCFPDVPKTHPESGYISLLKEAGIICGYGDGNFYPDNYITYTEAAKIVVNLLGYEPLTEVRGGYPDGCFTVMQNLELHKGWDLGVIITDHAKKEHLGIMLANAMDTPLMEQVVWSQSGEAEYAIMNGKNNTELVTLRTKLEKNK